MSENLKILQDIEYSLRVRRNFVAVFPEPKKESWIVVRKVHEVALNVFLSITRFFRWGRGFYDVEGAFREIKRIDPKVMVRHTDLFLKCLDHLRELKPGVGGSLNLDEDGEYEWDDEMDDLEGVAKKENFPESKGLDARFEQAPFFHLHGDEFGLNSQGYEGMGFTQSIPWTAKYLRHLKGNDPRLQPLYRLNELIRKKKGNVGVIIQESLKEVGKARVVLPGGWSGCPGHAMLYEIVPKESGKCDFIIYNSGSGLEFLPRVVDNYKNKFPIYTVFENVEVALFQNEEIQKVLSDFIRDEKGDYQAKHIYGALKSVLKPEALSFSKETKNPQRAGICSIGCIKYYLSSLFPKGERKQWMLDWEMLSLEGLEAKDLTHEHIHLVRMSCRKVARKVIHYYRAGLIGENYVKTAMGIIKDKLDLADSLEDVFRPAPVSQPNFDVRDSNIPACSEGPSIAELLKGHTIATQTPTGIGEKCLQAKSLVDLAALIQTSQDSSLEMMAGIDLFIENQALERVEQEMERMDRETLKGWMHAITSVTTHYAHLCGLHRRGLPPTPTIYYAGMKLLYLQFYALSKMEPHLNYTLGFGNTSQCFNSYLTQSHFSGIRHRELERMLQLKTPEFGSVKQYYCIKNSPFLDLYKFYVREDEPGSTENKAAVWAASDQMESHLKDLRDTFILGLYLTANILEPIPIDFKLHFEPEISNNVSYIKVVNFNNNGMMDNFHEIFLSLQKVEIHHFNSENELLSKNLKGAARSELSEESVRELARLSIRMRENYFHRNNCQIPELLHYFSKYPHLLNEPDFQTLFEYILFSNGQITNALPRTLTLLEQFIEKNVERAVSTKSDHAVVFLARVMRHLRSFQPGSTFYQKNRELVEPYLQMENLPEVRYLASLEWMAACKDKPELSDPELMQLFALKAFLTENQHLSAAPHLIHDATQGYLRHCKAMERVLNALPVATAEKVYATLRPGSERKTWSVKVDAKQNITSIESENGECVYYPWGHTLKTAHFPVPLPEWIAQHPDFKALFPGIRQAAILAAQIYALEYHGVRYLIHLEKEHLHIEREIEGKWCRFIPKHLFTVQEAPARYFTQMGGYLVKHYHHFKILGEEKVVLVSSPEKQHPEYTVEPNRIIRLSDSRPKIIADPDPAFLNLENIQFIHQWKGETELPRYGLKFTKDRGRWKTVWQGKTLFLSSDREKALGTVKGYLLLESAQGQRIVLLPNYPFKAPDNYCAVTHRYEVDRKVNLEDPLHLSCYTFCVDAQGKLHAKGMAKEAYLKLASTFLIHGEYEKAAHLLKRHGKKSTPYTSEESKILEEIVRCSTLNGDQSGEAMGIALYALHLLLEWNPAEAQRLHLDTLYAKYLSRLPHVHILKLGKKEELFLLDHCPPSQVFLRRFKELDPKKAVAYTFEEREKVPAYCPPTLAEAHGAHFNYFSPSTSEDTFNIKEFNLASPQKFYRSFFRELYHIARNGSPEDRRKLEISFHFGKVGNSSSDWDYFMVLYTVFHHPDRFPPLYSKDKLRDIIGITERLVDQAGDPSIEAEMSRYVATQTQNEHLPAPKEGKTHPIDLAPLPAEGTMRAKLESYFSPSVSENQGNKEEIKQFYRTMWEEAATATEKKEWERLLMDIDHVEKGCTWTIEKDQLTALRKSLQESSAYRVDWLEKALVCAVNKDYAAGISQEIKQLEVMGGRKPVITLDQLLFAYAKKDGSHLMQKNRALTEQDIVKIFAMTGRFLHLATLEQQRVRGLSLLDKVTQAKDEREYQELAHQLGLSLMETRHYHPQEFPAYLVFEYYSNILLRENQAKKLEQFLQLGESNPVIEMIMASGKSKVLMPLLAYLRADGQKLSLLVVPEPLFPTVSLDVHESLKESFGIDAYTFRFGRNSPATYAHMKQLRVQFEACIERGEPVMTTGKAVLSLVLRYIELCEGGDPLMLEEMEKMIHLFFSSGSALLDEIDSLLDVLHELNFSCGAKKGADPYDLATVHSIFAVLYGHFQIRPPIPQSEYFAHIKAELIQQWVATQEDLASLDQKLLTAYLSRDPSLIEEAQAFFDALPSDKLKNKLALAGEEFCAFLPHTLEKKINEKFGLVPDLSSPIAIPYRGAYAPSIGSEFANITITTNYTFMYFREKGIPKEWLKSELESLKGRAMKELSQDTSLSFGQTKSCVHFKELVQSFPLDLFRYSEADLDHLHRYLNSLDRTKLHLASLFALPKMELYPYKLSANSHHLAMLFRWLSGFTGTLWNYKSMHTRLTPLPSLGTDSKTIELLFKKSLHEVLIVEEESFKALYQKSSHLKIQMIADGGAYLIEGENKEVARAMAAAYQSPVLFYDKNGERYITDGKIETSYDPDKDTPETRRTFLDQTRTTGADVPQVYDAVAINTIGLKTKQRDTLQTAWRLRGLEGGQKVVFALSQKLAATIRTECHLADDQEITYKEILRFTVKNQAEVQQDYNYKAFLRELSSLPEMLLLKAVCDPNIPHKEELRRDLRALWVKDALKEPKDAYGKIRVEVATEVALPQQIREARDRIAALFVKYPFLQEDLDPYFNKLWSHFEGHLPEKVQSSGPARENDETVENFKEMEKEMAQIQDQEEGTITLGFYSGVDYQKVGFPEVNPLCNAFLYYSLDEALRHLHPNYPISQAFSNLHVSLNQFEFEQFTKNTPLLFGNHRHPFKYLRRRGEEIILVPHGEVNETCSGCIDTQLGSLDEERDLTQEEQLAVVQAKFLNGESNFKQHEVQILRDWLAQNHPGELKRFFLEVILAGKPDARKRLETSILKEILDAIQCAQSGKFSA